MFVSCRSWLSVPNQAQLLQVLRKHIFLPQFTARKPTIAERWLDILVKIEGVHFLKRFNQSSPSRCSRYQRRTCRQCLNSLADEHTSRPTTKTNKITKKVRKRYGTTVSAALQHPSNWVRPIHFISQGTNLYFGRTGRNMPQTCMMSCLRVM